MSRNVLKTVLLALIALAGCSLVRDQAYNLGYKERRVLDTLRDEPLYSLQAGGVFDKLNNEIIHFNGSMLTMRASRIVNGVERDVSDYTVEIVEDTSALEGLYRLYGTGPYSGQYVGIVLLTNANGAFAKLSFQDRPGNTLDTARSQAEWGWVTDPLAFRSFKTFPIGEPVVYLSDSFAVGGTDGTNASTTQEALRFIRLARPGLEKHTNVIALIDTKNTTATADDDYFFHFNEVEPGKTGNPTNHLISYKILTTRIIAPNIEVYQVEVTRATATTPIGPASPGGNAGDKGYIAIEFAYYPERQKVISRMSFNVNEDAAIAAMQSLPHYRWEGVSTADLPTRVLDPFRDTVIVQQGAYNTGELGSTAAASMPVVYHWQNNREFQFDLQNFSVRVLDVNRGITNASTYRFRMIDDISDNEGVVRILGTSGRLTNQYLHIRRYFPGTTASGVIDHSYTEGAAGNFVEKPGDDGQKDTRLLLKIGQGATLTSASNNTYSKDNATASTIIYQAKEKAYRPHRLFANLHKRGRSWVGVLDDGTYNQRASTNWNINAATRSVQIRISTNSSPRFSTYRFHTILDGSDNRIVAVLSNIPNTADPGDIRDGFLEPSLGTPFPSVDNDTLSRPFHGKYVAFDLGSGVDNARAKVEFGDSVADALRKLENRVAFNLYESSAIPTPNRIIKTLAGASPWIRLNNRGFFDANDTERFTFNADDMEVLISWHRGASADGSLDRNAVAYAKYRIPLDGLVDTSSLQGTFQMLAPSATDIRVPTTPGGTDFHPLPTDASAGLGAGDQYAAVGDESYFYSAATGSLADANKAYVGRGNSVSSADADREAVAAAGRWTWHTLADAPLSPEIILDLMDTIANSGRAPYVTSDTPFTVAPDGTRTGFAFKPYETYEYEFTDTPFLQMTVRRIQDAQVTSAVFSLAVVNNLDARNTIVRLGGNATLGNYAPGRFVRIRVGTRTDTSVTPMNLTTNVSITAFATRTDAENYANPIMATGTVGNIPNLADFNGKFNIITKSVVDFPLDSVPLNKDFQHLLPHRQGGADLYDLYEIFHPNITNSVFVRFTNVAAAGAAVEYRIGIKDIGRGDYDIYNYETMADDTADAAKRTLYVKLIGEGAVHHNRFAAFRFDAEPKTGAPTKMQASIGGRTFLGVSNEIELRKAAESTSGWRYRDVSVLHNKDISAFSSAVKMFQGDATFGGFASTFVRVDQNGVYRGNDSDTLVLNFVEDIANVSNMRIDISTVRGTANTFGQYYIVPLSTSPRNPMTSFPGSASTVTPPIPAGDALYGYLIYAPNANAAPAVAPFNRQFVILRTDARNPDPADDNVRNLIFATNTSGLGAIDDGEGTATTSTSAFSMFNFWWKNAINRSPAVPILAFNYRNQASVNINSRVIDNLAVNKWVILSNIPAGRFGAGSVRQAYTLDPDNAQIWTVDAATRQITIENRNNGTASTGVYTPVMVEAPPDNDYRGYFSLVHVSGAYRALDQQLVYAQLPYDADDDTATANQRTRDARIIVAGTTIGTGSAIVNNLTAMRAAAAAISTENEWNAANFDLALVEEQAFKTFHRRLGTSDHRFFYTYESGTSAVNPVAPGNVTGTQWNKDNWLAFAPLIRKVGNTDTKITNIVLARKGIGGDYSFTNTMNLMTAELNRSVLQVAGVNAAVTAPAVNLSNQFMAIEYGTEINDRTAKVSFGASRAAALQNNNVRTVYNYFDSEMATNSGNNEQFVQQVITATRGVEWVQLPNSLHNAPTATPPGLSLPAEFPVNPTPVTHAQNIKDASLYELIPFSPDRTINIQLDPANKVLRELRIGGGATNTFVYGYTVIESSLEPSLDNANPTTPENDVRYRIVVRLEGFGDYKNRFLAGEIGQFTASGADPEIERFKGRIIFGRDVAEAKERLTYLQGTMRTNGAPTEGSWNFVAKSRLTKPSALLNNTTEVEGYPGTPASRKLGISQRTADPAVTGVENADFYAPLATATGAESNAIDVGNHTNFVFAYDDLGEPFVIVTSIRSNVDATVRYRATVIENFVDSPQSARRTNDVIIQLDNLGAPLHSKYLGIRRHNRATPATVVDSVVGDYFSLQIADTTPPLLTAMGAANANATVARLPITLRFKNDLQRSPGSDQAAPAPSNYDMIFGLLTDQVNAGSFVALDGDGIYMPLSNSTWNYNNSTGLLNIIYNAPAGQRYADPISGANKNPGTAESYRVIPVMTTVASNTAGAGTAVVVFRSDDSLVGGAAPTLGFLHNKYVAISYHGAKTGRELTGSQLVFLTNADTLRDATNRISSSADAALYTLLAPYTQDLTPFQVMDAVRNPDESASFPGIWAQLNTNLSGTLGYQFDPSNTTLYKVDLPNRKFYLETLVTTVGSSGSLDYSGTTARTAVEFRLNLVRAIEADASAANANRAEQILFTLVSPRAIPTGTVSPVSGVVTTGAPSAGQLAPKIAMLRTKKRVSTTPTFEDISAETLYFAIVDRSDNIATDREAVRNILNATPAPDPSIVAAYTTAVSRDALTYWNTFLGRDDWWFSVAPNNVVATNTYNPVTGANPDKGSFSLDPNTGNNGGGHGVGGATIGVLNINMGFIPSSGAVSGGNPNSALGVSDFTRGKMLNFWQRLIRQVDDNTFIFQLYRGQNMSGAAFGDFSSDGVTYTADSTRAAVSNKYWIIRAGTGVDLFRARITNGATAAEALQNLGTVTSPNLAAWRGVNRIVLTNIPKGVDFVGNAEVTPGLATAENPSTLTAAQQQALFANRAPVSLEVDNHTNWNFGSDLLNPSVTITVSSRGADGLIVDNAITYGIVPLSSPDADSTHKGLFALNGFGPFAGRIFSVNMDSSAAASANPRLRIAMAPASLGRGLTPGTTTTNANLAFLLSAMNAGDTDTAQSYLTPKASVVGATTNWSTSDSFYNFTRRSSLDVTLGIASELNNGISGGVTEDKTLYFKYDFSSGAGGNTALRPSRWHDPNNTTNYSVDTATTPPTFRVAPSGASSVGYSIAGVTTVATASQNIRIEPTGGLTAASVTYGALRAGSGNLFYGIKFVTTNSGVLGNAGVYVRSYSSSLQAAHDAIRDIGTTASGDTPDHSYGRDITFTRHALTYVSDSRLGTLSTLNGFGTYTEGEGTEYLFDGVSETVQVLSLRGGNIQDSAVYTLVPVKDWASAAPSTTPERASIFLLKGQGSLRNTFLKVLNSATRVRDSGATGLEIAEGLGFHIESAQNTTNLTGAIYTDSTTYTENIFAFNTRPKSLFVATSEADFTTFNLNNSLNAGTTHSRSASYRGLLRFSQTFNGKYSLLRDNVGATLESSGAVEEIEVDYPKKLLLRRLRSSGSGDPTVQLYAIVATNVKTSFEERDESDATRKFDSPAASDRGNYYLWHLGNLKKAATIEAVAAKESFAALQADTALWESAANPRAENRHWSFKLAFTGHNDSSTGTLKNRFLAENDPRWEKVDSLYAVIQADGWDVTVKDRRAQESSRDPGWVPLSSLIFTTGSDNVNRAAEVITNFNRELNSANGFVPAIPVTPLGNYETGTVADQYALAIVLTNDSSNPADMQLHAGFAWRQFTNEDNPNYLTGKKVGSQRFIDDWVNQVYMAKYRLRLAKYNNGRSAVYRIFKGEALTDLGAGMFGSLANFKPPASVQPQPAKAGISNYFIAVQVGDGDGRFKGRVAFGETVREAEQNLARIPHQNYIAGAAAQSFELLARYLVVHDNTRWTVTENSPIYSQRVAGGTEAATKYSIKVLDNDAKRGILFIRPGETNPNGDILNSYSFEVVWGMNYDAAVPVRNSISGRPFITNLPAHPSILYGYVNGENSVTSATNADAETTEGKAYLNRLKFPLDRFTDTSRPVGRYLIPNSAARATTTGYLNEVRLSIGLHGGIIRLTGFGPLSGTYVRFIPLTTVFQIQLMMSPNIEDLFIPAGAGLNVGPNNIAPTKGFQQS